MAKIVKEKEILERLERRAPAREGAVAKLIETQLGTIKENPNAWYQLEGVKSISYVRRIIVRTLKEKLLSKGGNWVLKRIEGKCFAKYVVGESKEAAEETEDAGEPEEAEVAEAEEGEE